MSEKDLNKQIAEQIKYYREMLGMSQQQLADKMEVPQPSIARLESGNGGFSLKTLKALSEALGLTFSVQAETNDSNPADLNHVINYTLHSLQKLLTSSGGDFYDVTNMKLNKLIYYIQMVSLGKYNKRLFKEKIEAWQYGPVCREIYDRYKSNNSAGIQILKPELKENEIILGDDQRLVIDTVVKNLGMLSAIQLMSKTHSELPWINAYTHGRNSEISLSDMKNYFSFLNL
jgi:uncharacterized phage-associated protein/DNA-binding XRE family transcriptional regulator